MKCVPWIQGFELQNVYNYLILWLKKYLFGKQRIFILNSYLSNTMRLFFKNDKCNF